MFSLFNHGPILEDISGFALSVTSQGKRHNAFLGKTSKTRTRADDAYIVSEIYTL